MGFFDEVGGALEEIYSEFAQPLIWRGRELRGIVAQAQGAMELESGGFVPQIAFTVKLRERELGGECPTVGEMLEYNRQSYRITGVSIRSHCGQIELSLEAADK